MATTNHLAITLIEQSQAQKEVTVNEAISRLEAILNTGVKDKDIATPPGSPAEGDVYIVAASPTGAWSGKAKHIGYYNQTWRFITPNEGMTLWVNDENLLYSYDGTNWVLSVSGGGGNLDSLSDVVITSPATGQVVKYNGTNWVNDTISGGGSSDLNALTDVTITSAADNHFLVHNGTEWVNESAATARVSMGLGVMATQSDSSVAITGGSISGITDLAVADGGTGASTAAAARTNLGVVIGTDVQAFDSDLSAVAGLSTTGLISRTGAGTAATRTLTAPAAGVTFTNGDGVSGNPTLALANDIAAVEGLSSMGIAVRTATDTWTTRSIAAGSSNLTLADAGGVAGNPTLTIAETVWVAASDETTTITTGTNKATFAFPYNVTITGVGASLNTVSTSGTPTIDINESGTTILSTKITIDANEKTSLTAATAPVISDSMIAAGNEVGIDIDVAGTGAKGLKVWMIYRRTS